MTGRIATRNGYLYAVISYKDEFGKFKQKWINSELKERGNKKEANAFLKKIIEDFDETGITKINQSEPAKEITNWVFTDYIESYLAEKEPELSPVVVSSYQNMLKVMKTYFSRNVMLKDVTYTDLLKYYDYLKNKRKNKNITIKHHAIILSPALRMAYRDGLIEKNPYEFMPKLKLEKPQKKYYNKDELEELFKVSDKSKINLIIRVAAYYGFRRSEILGLKWDAIDFDNKTISIKHKVLTVGQNVFTSDYLKTNASHRTLPLLPAIEEMVIKRKQEIEQNKKLYGRTYNNKYNDYIFINDIGDLILPDYVTSVFNKILKRNNLKHIRFHDLRHSCASLLVANKVPMKNIQEWLGHSNFNTTADVYSHLDFSSKIQSANIIDNMLTQNGEKTIEDEIEELTKLIEEKKKLLKKSQSEM